MCQLGSEGKGETEANGNGKVIKLRQRQLGNITSKRGEQK